VLARDNQPITAADVRLRLINPSQDWRGPWHEAESVDSGIYVTAGGDVSTAGNWLAVYDITPEDGDPVRAVFDWQISDAASIIETRDPNFLNIGALVAIIVVCVWLILPLLRRLYCWLDWRPSSIAAGGSAVVATILFIVLAVVMGQQSELDYARTINPAPKIVNNILPDSQSLARGQALYTESCPNWQESRRDWALLAERIDRLRDEELYAITENGWQDLPPCDDTLDTDQRWDIVNYLRTLSE
ncbi:MAG: cytochrome c, partial [Anaerolineae bacterium]|nr:cytochrome c [Anaerolineae bacterium]